MYNQITSNKRKSFALILIFIVIIAALAGLWSYYAGGNEEVVVVAFLIASLMALISFYAGDKVALAQSGARPIRKEDNPYVWRLVENLSIANGSPLPKIYVIEDEAMNAFATGRDPQHASIAVTTGLINGLENEELEGVIAHELSHIKNYDIRVMMLVIVLIGMITLLADWMLRSFFWGGRSREHRNNGGGLLLLIGLVLAILSPIFAELIKLAVSRQREYLADASGALLTRYPEGLARALEKISAQNLPLRRANKATAHLYIANPFSGKNLARLFSTHPPITERVEKLRQMV